MQAREGKEIGCSPAEKGGWRIEDWDWGDSAVTGQRISFVEVVEKQQYNAATEKTIRDARAGKGLHKANGTKDLMKQLDS